MAEKITDSDGRVIPFMGIPMGAADFSAADFIAQHPSSGENVLFGIDPESKVTLTVVNALGVQVEHTFQAGPNPYFIKAIKQQESAVTVNYYI